MTHNPAVNRTPNRQGCCFMTSLARRRLLLRSAQVTMVGASSQGQSVGAISLGVAPVVKILNSPLLDALKRIAKVLGLTPTELLD